MRAAGKPLAALMMPALATLALLSCGSSDTESKAQGSDTAPRAQPKPAPPLSGGSRVFVIVLENREYGQVIGNPRAPYVNRLARRGALAKRYFAITHPSLPNYLAILGGSTFGIHSDCTGCSARDPNLALQLEEAGISWRAYMEGLPRPCYPGAFSGRYAKKHNPFLYFPSIRGDPILCAEHVVPANRLGGDIRRGQLAAFSWITPDLCNDAHDCGLGVSDRYLARLVPRLLPQLGADGFLVLTFDEGKTDRGCCGSAYGGRIATVLAGPGIRHAAGLGQAYDHYSLLRTLEDAFSLAHLRGARQASSMRAAFERVPRLP